MIYAWLVALVVAFAGCIQSASVPCGDGTVCPEGTTCDVTRGRCVSAVQTAACAGLAEGDACTLAGAPGRCRDRACELLICGDGLRTAPEACDGLDLGGQTCASQGFEGDAPGSGLACAASCLFDYTGCAGFCGDGVVGATEQCDGSDLGGAADCTSLGFYDPPGLTCSSSCLWDVSACGGGYCGDGVINGTELCDGAPPVESCVDLGYDAGRPGCASSCSASFSPCARFGWRTELLPGAPEVRASDAAGPGEVWVVGSAGYAARHGVGGWEVVPTGVTTDLVDVTAPAPDQAWAIGSGATDPALLLRWSGASWQPIASPPAGHYRVVSAAAGWVFIGTDDGVIAWTGTAWQTIGALPGRIVAIEAIASDDVWAATATEVVHWDGTTWLSMLSGSTQQIVALGPDDVYVIGRDTVTSEARFARWNGQSWSIVLDRPTASFAKLGASAPNDVWIAGAGALRHFDGQRLIKTHSIIQSGAGFAGLHTFGPGHALAIAGNGAAYRYRGQMFINLNIAGVGNTNALWGDGVKTVMISTNVGSVATHDGENWRDTVVQPATPRALTALWGTSADDAWAGGMAGTVHHFDGTAWAPVFDAGGPIRAIWGTSSSDVWVFGKGAHHFDGTTWVRADPAPNVDVKDARGIAGDDVWAAAASSVYRWDGTSWTTVTTFGPPVTSIESIAIAARDDVYLAFDQPRVLRYDGTSWTSIPLPSTAPIRIVAATAPDDVFAASDKELFHFDGAEWTPVRFPLALNTAIEAIHARPNRVDVLMNAPSLASVVSLLRTRPWTCRLAEQGASCSDGVDDDCDGRVDGLDPDCP